MGLFSATLQFSRARRGSRVVHAVGMIVRHSLRGATGSWWLGETRGGVGGGQLAWIQAALSSSEMSGV